MVKAEATSWRWALSVSATMAAVANAAPALAEESESNDKEPVTISSNDIVVTARRRSELIQDVPVSITAVTGATLEARGIRSAEDLRILSPSLNVGGQARDNANFYMRGQTPGVIQLGQRNFTSVATYFAEVPANVGGPGLFFDLGGVQVLKGPQGTLFGRNTTGGAVLFEPQAPVERVEGFVRASGGNFDFFQFEGAANVPLGDVGALRLAGIVSSREGYTQSILTDQMLDGRKFEGMRLSVLLRPADGLTSTTIIDYRHKDNSGSGNVLRAINPAAPFGEVPVAPALAPLLGLPPGSSVTIPLRAGGTVSVACLQAALPGCPTGPFGGAVAAFQQAFAGGQFANPATGGFFLIAPTSTFEDALALQRQLGPRRNAVPLELRNRSLDWGITNRTTWDISPDITLKNIIAFRQSRANSSVDYDGAAFQTIDLLYNRDDQWAVGQDQFTQEFQVQGQLPSANLKYILGFYHELSKPGFEQNLTAVQFGSRTIRVPANRDESNAVFGHFEWQPSSLFGLSGGIRQTWDKREASISGFNAAGACNLVNPATGVPQCPISYDAKFDALTYDVTASFTPVRGTLLFASYRRGYKSGGFTLPAPDGFETFDPEKVDSIEVGIKSDFTLGIRMRANISAFYDTYNDVQVSSPTLAGGAIVSVVQNVGKQTNKGVEGEFAMFPVDGLTLGGFFSFVSAESDVDVIAPSGVPTILAGLQIPFTPRWKWGVNGSYSVPFGANGGDLTFAADYSWQSEQLTNDITAPVNSYPSYALLNGRIEWRDSFAPGVDLALFATNLLDKTYILGGYPLVTNLGFESAIFGEPRMFGGSVTFRWGGNR
jgi:iron complex outermembrane recepter protein